MNQDNTFHFMSLVMFKNTPALKEKKQTIETFLSIASDYTLRCAGEKKERSSAVCNKNKKPEIQTEILIYCICIKTFKKAGVCRFLQRDAPKFRSLTRAQ